MGIFTTPISDQEYEYNRISEGYEVFLIDKDEYEEGFELESEFLQKETLFKGPDFEGFLLMPNVACKGKNVMARVEIHKLSFHGVSFVRGVSFSCLIRCLDCSTAWSIVNGCPCNC